eukprot:7267497-Pyramimonas_sp.AAC.1
MGEPARVDWHRRNKKIHAAGQKKAFDDGIYEEESSKAAFMNDTDLYDYLPQDEWVIREKQLQDGLTTRAAIALFEEKCGDPSTAKRKIRNRICLGVFKGARVGTG